MIGGRRRVQISSTSDAEVDGGPAPSTICVVINSSRSAANKTKRRPTSDQTAGMRDVDARPSGHAAVGGGHGRGGRTAMVKRPSSWMPTSGDKNSTVIECGELVASFPCCVSVHDATDPQKDTGRHGRTDMCTCHDECGGAVWSLLVAFARNLEWSLRPLTQPGWSRLARRAAPPAAPRRCA